MNAPRRLQRPRRWALRHLRGIRRRFHEQAFGEELTRVNLDFSPGERRAYLAWMREHSRRNGVPRPPNHSVAWLVELEQELAGEANDSGDVAELKSQPVISNGQFGSISSGASS
jgi:hypothetical protein